ncbi:sialidase family protein [Edaphobacter albus]|uniref:sialidase family protein n=1 Tax=Edaphobacter sp. 4G125 TaxID=2763071 RepID=UPI0016483014|nr:sialidase family protein [Edaphobacter sp. 4G125]QNI36829.1 exo-alpha-sialidase [Edaphobacter sp. 4G125]
MCRIAFLLCVGLLLSPHHAIADTSAAALFANGTDSYACFRIPAIVRTPKGTLLAFAEARRHNCGDFGEVRIVMRSSRDEGKSWSPLTTVATNGELQAGNLVPVVDTRDRRYPRGRIFLVYCTGNASEASILKGEGARRIWYRTSTDEGLTWGTPVEITANVKLPSWRGYATGPGHGLQLMHGQHAGRILIAANHSEGNPQPHDHSYDAHAFYSDDHGQTWHLSDSIQWPGSNESTAAEAADGVVVMNSRDQSKETSTRILAISNDGGAHWASTFVAKELIDPACEGSMLSYRYGKRQVLLFSNASDQTQRINLTISASFDNGKTWPKRTVIEEGPAAYSDIVALKGKQLGVLWERGNDGGIFFTAQPIDPLLR